MMREIFSLEMADHAIKAVMPVMLEARALKREIEMIACKYEYDKARMDEEKVRKKINHLADCLSRAINAIEDQGGQVRDLDIGIVEFPGEFGGEDIFYCTRMNDKVVKRWHYAGEGCALCKEILVLDEQAITAGGGMP
jgi:hypothetical protein